MGLYKLFSCNVEVQYKNCLLSKAMVFTFVTTLLNIILPFIIAYRSKGFWLRTHSFYEQPVVQFTYQYLLVAETDDPSQPIVCGDILALNKETLSEESCAKTQVQEYDYNDDGKYDLLEIMFYLNIPANKTVSSIILVLGLDFQLKAACPLHMQSLGFIDKTFSRAPSEFKFYGDIALYQVDHLACISNVIDTKYNNSLFYHKNDNNNNKVDFIQENYLHRQVTTQIKTLYSRSQNGHTGNVFIKIHLRIPEMQIRYLPSLLQELKWAWPQYLSLVVIFYWIFNKIKKFVFNHRLLMAWEITPWKKDL